MREGWLEENAAVAMLAWPHSSISAYVGPVIAARDRAAVLRVARYGARAPVAESRLTYDAERAEVELASDASDGPCVGAHRMSAVGFLARLVNHIPGKGEVRVRYGAYEPAARRRAVVRGSTAPRKSRPGGARFAGRRFGGGDGDASGRAGEMAVVGRSAGAYDRRKCERKFYPSA